MGSYPIPEAGTEQVVRDLQSIYREGTKRLADFPEPYRTKLRIAYRFSGHWRSSKNEYPPPMSRETLEVV